jgi:4-amino-4-deoxy-L-arabinose transferase-like glycosyltransferase
MEVRKGHLLPEIHFDFSSSYSGQVIDSPGDADVRNYTVSAGVADPPLRLLPAESVQPPLYFWIASAFALLVPPTPQPVLYISRFVSALFGAGMIYFCWVAARQIAPRAPIWAVAAAGAIALLPEVCFNDARAANDSLLNLVGAASFYVWFRGLRQPDYDPWMLRAGTLLGLGVLSKLTALVLVPGLVLMVVFRVYQTRFSQSRWRERLQRGARLAAGAAISALLVCGWWFVRNILAYGEPTGTAASNVFWHRNLPLFNWDDLAARNDFMLSSWRSFWGFFGWQTISMPPDYYDQAGLLSIVFLIMSGIAGLIVIGRWVLKRHRMPAHRWQSVLVMALVAAVQLVAFVQFSLNVALEAQGRYLFLLLLPAALLFTGGLHALAPGRLLKTVALSAPLLWLAFWNVVGLTLVP